MHSAAQFAFLPSPNPFIFALQKDAQISPLATAFASVTLELQTHTHHAVIYHTIRNQSEPDPQLR